jgi:membrane-associated phospholipid phosphatase
MSKPFIIFLLLFTIFGSAKAKQPTDSCLVARTIRHGWKNFTGVATSPISWDKKDWIVFGSGTALTAGSVFFLDKQVYQLVKNNQSDEVHYFFRLFEPVGDLYPALTFVGLSLHGLIKKDNYNLETALMLAESYAANRFFGAVAKYTAGRARPDNESDPLQWKGPFKGESFYSGHTSTAFAVASVLAYRYRETPWVPATAYSIATLGSLGRVYHNHHWLSDALFGAMTGTAIGLFIAKNHKNNPFQVFPILTPSGASLTLVIPVSK